MTKNIIDRALALIKTHPELKIFPVSVKPRVYDDPEKAKTGSKFDKTPAISKQDCIKLFGFKGGAELSASNEAEVVSAMFKHASWSNDVGVAIYKSGMVLFDVDSYKNDDTVLVDWIETWRPYAVKHARIHRSASGGEHWLFKKPDSLKKVIGSTDWPFDEVEIKGQWCPWVGKLYTEVSVPDELGEPHPDMFKVVRNIAREISGSGMMSREAAIEALNRDSTRHAALARITKDWATQTWKQSPEQRAEELEAWMRLEFTGKVEQGRLDTALKDLDTLTPEGEHKGEMGRLLQGALDKYVWNAAVENFAASMSAHIARHGPTPKIWEVAESAEVEKLADGFASVVSEGGIRDGGYVPHDWLVKHRLIRGKVYGYSGPSNVGKTTYLAYLIACLTSGKGDMWGVDDFDPKRVLFVANEEADYEVTNKILAALRWNEVPEDRDRLFYVRGEDHNVMKMTKMDKDGRQEGVHGVNLKAITEFVQRNNIDVVFFDPFQSLGMQGDTNEQTVSGIFEFMRSLSKDTGCVSGFVHHPAKMSDREADFLMGDLGAFRGHGSIGSMLQGGQTIWPVVPYFNPQKGKDGKEKANTQAWQDRQARVLKELQNEGKARKFVRVDDVKVRGKFQGARCYEMVANDDEPASYVPFDLKKAKQVLIEAVEGVPGADLQAKMAEVSAKKLIKDIAEALYEGWPDGEQGVRNAEVHKYLVDKGIENYSESETLRTDKSYWQTVLTEIRLISVNDKKQISVTKTTPAKVNIGVFDRSK